jgi:hypothetical protein
MNRKKSLYLVLIALTITLAIYLTYNQKTETFINSVKAGNIIKYQTHYRGVLYSEESSNQTNIEYYTLIEILDKPLNNITFKETLLDLDGNIIFKQIISGNPAKPHYTHPLFRVNDLFIPNHLTEGSSIPQTLVLTDEQDKTKMYPWSQRINETVRRVYCEASRAVNHITWERYIEGVLPQGRFVLFKSKNDYYDQATGVLLESHLNSSKKYFDFYNRKTHMYVSIYDYEAVKTNLWNQKTLDVWVVTLTVSSLFFATIYVSWKIIH